MTPITDAPLRDAIYATVRGLHKMLLVMEDGDFSPTGNSHLHWMCTQILLNAHQMPVDKMSRWTGFIQGVLAAHDDLDVEAERARTRPFFVKAYEAMGLATTPPDLA